MNAPQWRTVPQVSPVTLGVPVFNFSPPPSPTIITPTDANTSFLHSTMFQQLDNSPSPCLQTPAETTNFLNNSNSQPAVRSSMDSSTPSPTHASWCRGCGQIHKSTEPHVYDYTQDVDEDLLCGICLQPLVTPTDTRCGHTFCQVCLTSHLRSHWLCPIDRTQLNSNDCQPASLMVRRLVDKLIVKCPFSTRCETTLPRSDLESHLNNRCSGALIPCPHAPDGCSFIGPRRMVLRHQAICSHSPKSTETPKSGVVEGERFCVEIPRSAPILGVKMVGGCDSPLRCIVIQEIAADGLIAKDSRLQAGDQIVEINGKDVTNITHQQACSALREVAPTLRLKVYREKIDSCSLDVFRVSLEKQTGKQLGIKLISNRHDAGIYISELISGSVACTDGRLKEEDIILHINGQDMRKARLEEASLLIQTSPKKVDLIVARNKHNILTSRQDLNTSLNTQNGSSPPGTTVVSPADIAAAVAKSKTLPASLPSMSFTDSPTENTLPPPRPARKPNRAILDRSLQPRYIKITKMVNEGLGIRIFGGLQSQSGDTPVYVTNMVPQGCVARCKQIKKGDVLLSVNGVSLLGVAHTEAVAALKATTANQLVTIGIVDGPETADGSADFVPSWMYWQQLPRSLQIPRTIVLRRSPTGNLGFSIVGGQDSAQNSQTFHVLLVVPNSIAAREGRLRCGDQILSVNGHKLEGVRHSAAVALLKQNKTKVILDVLSWPGTAL